ncbi:acetate kinase [Psychrosphaera aquimarina]|uniref:Acetate kinase n=1 Tax=Psychrosphaera aquimarina TaxID=2044854 RepID=A0ABU3QWL0_9GAMM|nr:acetate kinase [Psychrosphaera aquimarina]MDU0111817.1 acetate kinase [Psychrosphaera aquimarina]
MSTEKNILVLNCGSSSLKFAVINSTTGDTKITGLAERLGSKEATITVKYKGNKQVTELTKNNQHLGAIEYLVSELHANDLSDSLTAVGHRVVHGGEVFTSSAVITDDVIAAIEETSGLAPLHNPANLVGIKAAQATFPSLPQVAVFDTAFHQTMPQKAFMYAVDNDLYNEKGIRRYGFHGTSHYFVSREAAKHLQQQDDQTSVITVHLGNGCSICAIENGNSVDTSMGLTPAEGLVMGTRSGDVDPGLIIYLMNQHNYSAQQIDNLLNKQSGLLGLSKLSNDCRTLEDAVFGNDEAQQQQAKLALDVFCYRVAKYIASYTVALSHLDAIVFTGGIGENSNYIRSQVISQLSILKISLDEQQNELARFGNAGEIQATDSQFRVLVIPTNEEWVIARDAAQLSESK